MSPRDFYAMQLRRIPVHASRIRDDGVATAFWNYGPKTGPIDIVMVHGFRGDHHGLEPFVAMLGESLRIVIPDLPGFGNSDELITTTDDSARIAGYARWLRGFLDAVGADSSTTILGHSFGSIVVAAAFASGLTQKRCVLVNPIAANALSGPRGLLTRLAVWYYKVSSRLPERVGQSLLRNRAIVRVMSSTMAKTKNHDLRRWIHGQHDAYFSSFASRDSVLNAFQASVQHDVSEFVDSLPRGTLLIVAERDDITALPEQRTLANRIPDSELVIVPDVGHLVHYEAPEIAAAAISSYIGSAK